MYAPAKVVVLGGGVAGAHAVDMAVGLRAAVTIVDRSLRAPARTVDDLRRAAAHGVFDPGRTSTRYVIDADLVIGAVLIAGAAAPKLVTRDMVRRMKPGSVLVDISIDQGGCFETSRPTTHAEPTYVVDDVIHYCVTNMPGAVPRTSTFALNNATLPFARRLADHGWQGALRLDPHLANGLNVHAGHINNAAVARELGYEYEPVDQVPELSRRRLAQHEMPASDKRRLLLLTAGHAGGRLERLAHGGGRGRNGVRRRDRAAPHAALATRASTSCAGPRRSCSARRRSSATWPARSRTSSIARSIRPRAQLAGHPVRIVRQRRQRRNAAPCPRSSASLTGYRWNRIAEPVIVVGEPDAAGARALPRARPDDGRWARDGEFSDRPRASMTGARHVTR